MNTIQYDASRKSGITQTFKASDGTNLRKVFMPVPYNIGFELNIMTKLNDDALQIVEQILPYFQPSFNLTVDLVSVIGEKRDISVVLDSISFQDDYEGDFSTRRALIYTLQFTAKTYLFGPVADTPEGLIKKVQVDYHTTTDRELARRQVRYAVTPKALKDYNDDNVCVLNANITKTKTRLTINDSSNLAVDDRIIIDSEIMKVTKLTSTSITVKRAHSATIAAEHRKGAKLNVLSTADDALVAPGDDFGFNEDLDFFESGADFSPTRKIDI